MLVARLSNGSFISLCEKDFKRDMLLKLRKEEQFFCPACRNEVLLKLGNKKSWHFAHKTKLNCLDEIEGETEYHIVGKKLIYEWLVQQQLEVKLEPYLQHIKQRPDLLVKLKSKKFAIEFQCAKIPYQVFQKRTLAYLQNNYVPIWIPGGKQLLQKTSNVFNLNSFMWLFSLNFHGQSSYPTILSFCPENKLFISLNNILAFSANRSICTPAFHAPNQFSFASIFQPSPTHLQIETWFRLKRQWRNYYKKISEAQYFLKTFYMQKGIGVPYQLFPALAGVPTASHYYFETPTYIWQSYLIEMFIVNKNFGEKIHINLINRAIRSLIKKGTFKKRTMPQIIDVSLDHAIQSYLQFLCYNNVLQTKDRVIYLKKVEIVMPKTIDQAYVMDRMVEEKFKKYLRSVKSYNLLK